jgi:hypothetical protein
MTCSRAKVAPAWASIATDLGAIVIGGLAVKSMLGRLAQEQGLRARPEPTRYSDALDVLLVRREGRWKPAVWEKEPPQTKKADIEKGEDQKDRWR